MQCCKVPFDITLTIRHAAVTNEANTFTTYIREEILLLPFFIEVVGITSLSSLGVHKNPFIQCY